MNTESSSRSGDSDETNERAETKTQVNPANSGEGSSSMSHNLSSENQRNKASQETNQSGRTKISSDRNDTASSSSTAERNGQAAGPSTAARANVDCSGTGRKNTDPDNWLAHDPTPYHNMYPCPKWFSVNQLIRREYGRNLVGLSLASFLPVSPWRPYSLISCTRP